jgi:hypothetical protein
MISPNNPLSPLVGSLVANSGRLGRLLLLPGALAAACEGLAEPGAAIPADDLFGHEIRPILEKYCFECHGPGSKMKGGLDLSSFATVMKGGSNGPVILPGRSAQSPMYTLVADGDMPGEDADPVPEEILKKIGAWIDGARFPSPEEIAKAAVGSVHDRAKTLWSFHPPVRPPLPGVKAVEQVRTPVDRFILAKLEREGHHLSQDADRRTAIRRLSYDLIGLPPTPREIAAYLADDRPDAWERLVDRLLESPQYGEHWGRHWLDVAGWSESTLLIQDFVRPGYWAYRDWVIQALNRDLPYDDFVRQQLAGDEMTAWRNADTFTPDMIDKLTATGFLRSTPDGTDNQLITQEEKRFATQQTAVEVANKALLGLTLNCVRCHDHKFDPITQKEYYRTIAVFAPAFDLEKWLPGMVNTFGAGPVRVIPVADKAGRAAFHERMEALGARNAELSYQRDNGIPNRYRDQYVREHMDALPADFNRALLTVALTKEERQRTPEEKSIVYLAAKDFDLGAERIKGLYPKIVREQAENQKQQRRLADEGSDIGQVIWGVWDVSTDPTPVHLLRRGDFKTPGAVVEPGIIETLDRTDKPWKAPPVDPKLGTTGRRLAYADWLVRPDHPLTARVMVNRIWQFHFGTGIVSTPDDFGTRGAKPSHPELLDWLATEFVRSGWSIKHLHRLILNSSTYRQASAPAGELGERLRQVSPQLLAAFPRRRIEAEALRDAMLSVGQLLDPKLYGPSIPTVAQKDGSYTIPQDQPARFRRSIYLSTRRTQLPTLLQLFDAPSMDTNWPERHDSAIAPQALALANDPFVIECADALAGRILRERFRNTERIEHAFEICYGRPPHPDELRFFTELVPADGAGLSLEDERSVWRSVAHALIGSSEFIYID